MAQDTNTISFSSSEKEKKAKLPAIFKPHNALWYGGASILSGAFGYSLINFLNSYKFHADITEMNSIKNFFVLEVIAIIAIKVTGKQEKKQHTKFDIRGWVAEMKQLLDVNKGESEDGSIVRDIKQDILKLLYIFDSFSNPDSEKFSELFNNEIESKQGSATISNKLKEVILTLELTPENITDTQRVTLLSKARFELTTLLHKYTGDKVPAEKRNTRTSQIDKVHALIGSFDSDVKERVKSPEVVFLALFVASWLTRVFSQDEVVLLTHYAAYFGFNAVMIIDYVTNYKSLDAMNYADDPVDTAIGWLESDINVQVDEEDSATLQKGEV